MSDIFLIPSGAKDYLISNTYSDAGLSIEIAPTVLRPSWYKAGFLKILLPIGNNWLPISNKSILLTWEQIIEIPYKEYRLAFTPETYLGSCNFIVKPYLIKYNPMSGSYQQVPLTVTADAPLTIAAAVTNAVVVPANPLRSPECLIVNNSNKNMWVTFTGAAATTAPPSVKVIAGGNYDVPGSYTGAINAIWEAAATGSAVFYGFTAQ